MGGAAGASSGRQEESPPPFPEMGGVLVGAVHGHIPSVDHLGGPLQRQLWASAPGSCWGWPRKSESSGVRGKVDVSVGADDPAIAIE